MVQPSIPVAAGRRDRALRLRRSIVFATATGAAISVGVVAGLARASNAGHAAPAATGATPDQPAPADPGATDAAGNVDPSTFGGLQAPAQAPQPGLGDQPMAVSGGS